MKVLSDKKWPGDRDSNPRMLSHQRFSRPPLSTAQPSPDNIIKKSYLVFLPKKLRHESFLLFTLRLFSYLRQQLCLNKIQKNKQANNTKEKNFIQILLEATPRFELGIKDLQSHALATWLCRQKLNYDSSK